MYSNNKNNKKSNITNGKQEISHSFLGSKSLQKKITKKIDDKDKDEQKMLMGTSSSINIKRSSLNLKKKKVIIII